jgi:hypothetical protein
MIACLLIPDFAVTLEGQANINQHQQVAVWSHLGEDQGS